MDTFLDEHRGAGVQHIGLYTEDIVSTAGTLSRAGVRFFSPPPTYYTEVSVPLLMKKGFGMDLHIKDPAVCACRWGNSKRSGRPVMSLTC